MRINVIGAFRYPCAIERYYARAMYDLGHMPIKVTPDKITELEDTDLTVVVKWCSNPGVLPHPRALIFTDLTTRFQQYYHFAQGFYDYVFLVHKEPMVDNKRIFYLPVAYDPTEHYYVERKKDIDCLFIGTMHPSRSFLKEIPLITRYGNEWGDTHDVYGDEFRDLCSRAKIIVNHHYSGDTTNMRDYEAPNFKALVLTDKTPFQPGDDVLLYMDKEDLEWKISHMLDKGSDDLRKQIAEHGYKTLVAGKYTYKDRMEEMLGIINGEKK